MTEQFHLSRLQVINWGVFDGYHSIPFREGGALIAGASGSGKDSPAAMRSCHSTRSRPVTASVTGCSTCRRVFISMK